MFDASEQRVSATVEVAGGAMPAILHGLGRKAVHSASNRQRGHGGVLRSANAVADLVKSSCRYLPAIQPNFRS
jgi:hypothetical protein